MIEQAYKQAEAAGIVQLNEDEAGPYQAIPQPGETWQPEGHPATQPHEYERRGTAKLLTLFRPSTGQVRAKGVLSAPNVVLHPWLQEQLSTVLAEIEKQQPRENLQLKITRTIEGGNDFVSYIDAIGELDGKRCLIDWKTTTSRYSEEPEGLLSLDPQLVCYSWISGIPDVAFIVFVRKQAPEIQYLKATISDEQRREFGRLVETTVQQLESGHFSSHSGIRFPQNGCVSCPHLGLCLDNQQLIETNLIRRPGASDLDWLDDLVD